MTAFNDSIRWCKLYLFPATLVALCFQLMAMGPVFAVGLVYVEADDGFSTGSPNLSPLSAIDSNVSAVDNLWGYRGFGSGAVIFESSTTADPGNEDSPQLTMTLNTSNGLVAGNSYDVYVAYWSSTGQDWTIQASLPSGSPTIFNRTGPLTFLPNAVAGTSAASALWSTPPTLTVEADRVMLLGKVGTATATGGQINLLIDDLPTTGFPDDITGANAFNYRSWIDGAAFVEAGTPLTLEAVINRDTGQLSISNNTGQAATFTSLSITSASQALNATTWTSITDNYDQGGGLDTDAWEITAPAAMPFPSFTGALTEIESAGASNVGATLASGGAPLNLGNVWHDTRFSDVQLQMTLASGTVLTLTPTYTGTAHMLGDFSNNGSLGIEDYQILTANLHTDVSTLGQAEAYLRGDMNGDLQVNYADFVAFRGAFPSTGAGSFAAVIGQVPEPSTALLVAVAIVAIGISRGGRGKRFQLDVEHCRLSCLFLFTSNQIQASSSRNSSMTSTRFVRYLAALAAIALFPTVAAHAINVTLIANDANGPVTSFNGAGNWSNAAAPSAGNDYFTGDFLLRTPNDGGNYTFAGNSLTVNNTNGYPNGLLYKGTGTTGVITINNLILNGGFVSHADGVGDLFQLAGNVNVAAPSTIYAKQGSIDISSAISGSSNLTIPQTDAPTDTGNRFVIFSGANSYTGNVDVAGKLRLGDTGSMRFNVGSDGVNNSVTGTGIAEYNGAFDFDLSGASTTIGNSWAITSVATQAYGDTFNIPGFFEYATGTWINGNYQFDEATGTLSVAPAPDLLTLRVNTSTGLVSIVNDTTGLDVNMNYYELRSVSGSLDLANWTSIDGDVPVSNTSWEKAGGSSATLLSETNLQGMTTLAPTNSTSLGSAYAGTLPEHQDLQFYYGTTDESGTLFRGFVEYVSGGQLGDYNGNGKVDAADYTVWRNTLGSNVPMGTGADGDGDGTIGPGDYTVWKTNFGMGSGAGSLAAQTQSVPEPGTIGLLLFAVVCGVLAGPRSGSRER